MICGVLFWCRLTLIAYTSIWSSCDGLDTYLNRSSRYLFSTLLVWEPFFLFFNCSWSIGFIWINSITLLFTNCLSTCISIVLLRLLLHFWSLCLNPHLRCPPFLVAHQISSTPGLRLSCSLIDFRSCITSPPFHLLLTLDLCTSILSSPGVSPVSLFPALLCYRPALGNSSKIYCRTSWLPPWTFRIRKFHNLCYTSWTLVWNEKILLSGCSLGGPLSPPWTCCCL